ncbi:hypothetical protein ACFO0M_21490 [Micromonospora mangrovi]|uniref:DUF11 domain-containing protein n=2 Tax=Micromonospora TaxID=1873 RepID=A0AAU8HA18_9ACTN
MTSQRIRRTGLTLLSLAASAALLPAAPAAAAAPRADLTVHLTTTDAITRGNNRAEVHVVATVDNIGTAAAQDATVAFQIPAGTTLGSGEAAWSCDAQLVCTYPYGSVPAGGSTGPLSLYLNIPDGPTGNPLTIGATVSTTSREVTRTNNTAQAQAVYGSFPDLGMFGDAGGGSSEMKVQTTGGQVMPTFSIENWGSATADDLRVAIDLPAGATAVAQPSGPTAWQCDLAAAPVVCVSGPFYPKDTASLSLPIQLPAGTADEVVTVHAKVTTSSPEWEVNSSNEVTLSYLYVTPVA